MATNIPGLEQFDCDGDFFSVGLKWEKWKRALLIYLDASGIDDSHKKRATLLHFGGIGLQEIFYNLPKSAESDVFEAALATLDQYFAPKQSKVYERHIFRKLKQENGEKFEKFLVRLRYQAEKCVFPNADEQLIDQIAEKCSSVELRKKILATGDTITLATVVAEANTLETVERQMTGFDEKPSTSSCNDVSNRRKRKRFKPPKRCSRCGQVIKRHKCPGRRVICKKCNCRGHYAKFCLSVSTRLIGPPSTGLPNKRSKTSLN